MRMPKDCEADERVFYAMKVALYLSDEEKTIETIVDESGMTVPEVRAGLEELMDRNLLTSTPAWKYRRRRT